MNPIRWSTNRWRSLAARLVVGPGHTLPALMALALAGCDGGQVTAPDGWSATRIANAATVAAPARAGAWDSLRIEAHYNFLTGQNSWTSSGAFVDFGTINVAETVHSFSPGTFKVEKVISPSVASDGSTITTMFTKVWTFTSETTLVAKGQWHIIGGTGRYAGITGQGDIDGDLDVVTGAGNDVFTGWVRWP